MLALTLTLAVSFETLTHETDLYCVKTNHLAEYLGPTAGQRPFVRKLSYTNTQIHIQSEHIIAPPGPLEVIK